MFIESKEFFLGILILQMARVRELQEAISGNALLSGQLSAELVSATQAAANLAQTIAHLKNSGVIDLKESDVTALLNRYQIEDLFQNKSSEGTENEQN